MYFDYVLGVISEQRQAGIRKNSDCMQDYCLLARWAVRFGLSEMASQLIELAQGCVNEISADQLWLLDYYELTGDDVKYAVLYSKLSEEDILPLERQKNK